MCHFCRSPEVLKLYSKFEVSTGKPPLDQRHARIFVLDSHLPQLEAGAVPLAEVRILNDGGEVQPEVPRDGL